MTRARATRRASCIDHHPERAAPVIPARPCFRGSKGGQPVHRRNRSVSGSVQDRARHPEVAGEQAPAQRDLHGAVVLPDQVRRGPGRVADRVNPNVAGGPRVSAAQEPNEAPQRGAGDAVEARELRHHRGRGPAVLARLLGMGDKREVREADAAREQPGVCLHELVRGHLPRPGPV